MDVIVGLGSNLGSREAFVRTAVRLLGAGPEIEVVALSRMYLTPPIGPPQPDFVNAAVRLESELAPRVILERTRAIEDALGRVRDVRWGPRTIDLDLLHWEGGAIDEPELTLPHARLEERSFAIAPLLDVAPELAPRYGRALGALGTPPARPWTEAVVRGGRVVVHALDDADALALAISAAFEHGAGGLTRIEAADAARFVRAVRAPASVVVGHLGPGVNGWRAGPEIAKSADKPWDLEHLGDARCVLRQGGSP